MLKVELDRLRSMLLLTLLLPTASATHLALLAPATRISATLSLTTA